MSSLAVANRRPLPFGKGIGMRQPRRVLGGFS
jgi:hypothetical protein